MPISKYNGKFLLGHPIRDSFLIELFIGYSPIITLMNLVCFPIFNQLPLGEKAKKCPVPALINCLVVPVINYTGEGSVLKCPYITRNVFLFANLIFKLPDKVNKGNSYMT